MMRALLTVAGGVVSFYGLVQIFRPDIFGNYLFADSPREGAVSLLAGAVLYGVSKF